jgi:flagellar basal-body rod modification protein FlgD
MSSTTSITPTTAASTSSSSSSSSSSLLPTQTLNQQDFLNLLVTELQNQDPMNPMSDTDFIAQMAQFSTLQQSQQTYQSMSEMQATNLIGSTVNATASGGATDTGVVTEVLMNSGTPEVLVNGTPYTLDEVQTVTPPPATSTTPTTTSSTTTPTSD